MILANPHIGFARFSLAQLGLINLFGCTLLFASLLFSLLAASTHFSTGVAIYYIRGFSHHDSCELVLCVFP